MLLRESESNVGSTSSNEYEVEEIIGKRIIGNNIYYKVFWKGYDISESTWEVTSNLKNCMDLVNAFEKKNNSKEKSKEKVSLLKAKRTINKERTLNNIDSNSSTSNNSKPSILNSKQAGGVTIKYPPINVQILKSSSGNEELQVYSSALHHPNSSIITSIFDSAVPNKILKIVSNLQDSSIIKLENELFCLVEFKTQPNGFQRENCLISTKIFKMFYPILLVDYYERFIKINN